MLRPIVFGFWRCGGEIKGRKIILSGMPLFLSTQQHWNLSFGQTKVVKPSARQFIRWITATDRSINNAKFTIDISVSSS
jgi:hypothetical protein